MFVLFKCRRGNKACRKTAEYKEESCSSFPQDILTILLNDMGDYIDANGDGLIDFVANFYGTGRRLSGSLVR